MTVSSVTGTLPRVASEEGHTWWAASGRPALDRAARRRDGATVAGYLDGGPAGSATLTAGVRDLLSERP
ncbi:hypothetical protein [Geodermatophilus sp. SYSU D01119]